MQKDGKIHCCLFALFFLIINFSDPAFEIPEVDGSLCSEETGVSVWDIPTKICGTQFFIIVASSCSFCKQSVSTHRFKIMVKPA